MKVTPAQKLEERSVTVGWGTVQRHGEQSSEMRCCVDCRCTQSLQDEATSWRILALVRHTWNAGSSFWLPSIKETLTNWSEFSGRTQNCLDGSLWYKGREWKNLDYLAWKEVWEGSKYCLQPLERGQIYTFPVFTGKGWGAVDTRCQKGNSN